MRQLYRSGDRGAAVVEFVLVSLIFLPLVMGIIQFGLFLHVRNTLVACAQEGARKAANFDAGPEEGASATRACIGGALNPNYARDVSSARISGEFPVVEMRINAVMPPLGFFASYNDAGDFLGGVSFQVVGHAVDEPDQP